MVKKKATTGDLDQKVVALMEKVKEKRKLVASLEKVSWSTTGSLQLPGWERLNIQIEQDVSKLVLAYGTLFQIASAYDAGYKAMELDGSRKWQGYDISEWLDDLRQRINVIGIKAERKKLADLEDLLNSCTSDEQRRAMKLAEIESQLS